MKYLLMIAYVFMAASCSQKQSFAEKIPKIGIIRGFNHTSERRWVRASSSHDHTKSVSKGKDIVMKDLIGRPIYVYGGERVKDDSIKLIIKRVRQLRKGMSEEEVVNILKPTYYGESLSAFSRGGRRDFYLNDAYQDLILIDRKLDNMDEALFVEIRLSSVPFSYPDDVPKLLLNGDNLRLQFYHYRLVGEDPWDVYELDIDDGTIRDRRRKL